MFPPDEPPPSRFRPRNILRPKSAKPFRFKAPESAEDRPSFLKLFLQIAFIIGGIATIIAIIALHPEEKRLVCDPAMRPEGSQSLTSFGSCWTE